MQMPTRVPEIGYYYHYKHDKSGPVNNYAYQVLSVGFHTESGEHLLNYRPLYEEAGVYQISLKLGVPCVDNRPLQMWMEDVTKDGVTFPRFTKITDVSVIAQLDEIRKKMYDSEGW